MRGCVAASASEGEDADCHRPASLDRDAVILAEGEVVGVGGVDDLLAGVADHRLSLFASPAGTGGGFVTHRVRSLGMKECLRRFVPLAGIIRFPRNFQEGFPRDELAQGR